MAQVVTDNVAYTQDVLVQLILLAVPKISDLGYIDLKSIPDAVVFQVGSDVLKLNQYLKVYQISHGIEDYNILSRFVEKLIDVLAKEKGIK